jgi:hypothetical protein
MTMNAAVLTKSAAPSEIRALASKNSAAAADSRFELSRSRRNHCLSTRSART